MRGAYHSRVSPASKQDGAQAGKGRLGFLPGYGVNLVASRAIRAYQAAMFRYFDMTDHARLPQRFSRENRSVLARLR